jgi:hypothetical protein
MALLAGTFLVLVFLLKFEKIEPNFFFEIHLNHLNLFFLKNNEGVCNAMNKNLHILPYEDIERLDEFYF